MKRRTFLWCGMGTLATLSTVPGCTRRILVRPPTGENGDPAGLDLESLRDQYRHYLFEDFLPFHYQYVIDHEHGGFMCRVDRDGTRQNTQKTAWYEGRGSWTYAFLYNNIAPNARHLETARRSVEFMLRHRPGDETFWPKSFSRGGTPLQPPDRCDLYGDCFIAAGIAEYAKAIGDDAYWHVARDILRKCVKLYDAPDFCPGDQSWLRSWLGQETPPITGARTLSAWMLFLWAARPLLDYKSDPAIVEIVDRSIEAVLHHHYNPEFDLINEVINHDLSHTGDAYDQFVPTATVNETLWMILHEAVRRRDRELFYRTAEHIRRHLEVGWDDVYGGMYMNCFNVDENVWDVHRKALWA